MIWTIAGLTATLLSPALRTGVGFLDPVICLVWALVIAVGVAIAALGTPWKSAALWGTLALLGQATSLQMIWAGKEIRYQHWRFALEPMSGWQLVLAAILVAQMLAVAAAARGWVPQGVGWLKRRTGVARALMLIGVFVLLSASGQKDPWAFATEAAVSSAFMLAQLANIVLFVRAVPVALLDRWNGSLQGWLKEDGTVAVDRFVVGAASAVALLAFGLNVVVWERHPHITDEAAYYIQAHHLADGSLSEPSPTVPEAFELYLVPCDDERCYSVFPPGWPAVLSLGVRIGAPSLINPLLGGLNIVLLYLLIGLLYELRTARIGVALAMASPWYLFMAMNYMSHTWALTCALVAAVSCAKVWREARTGWLILGGAALGLLSLTRPLDAAAIAPVLGVWMLFSRGWRPTIGRAFVLTASSMAFAALVLPYNGALTGEPLTYPVAKYMNDLFGPGANALGFGPNRGGPAVWGAIDAWPGHTPSEAAINTTLNANAIHTELFGWSIGSLTLLLLYIVVGMRGRRDWAVLTPVVTIAALYALYYFAGGPDFGARYWYLAIVPAVVLTARALLWVGSPVDASDANGLGRVVLGAGLLSIVAVLTFVPWRAVDKYHRYWQMGPEVRERVQEGEFAGGLVLIQGAQHPDYSSARAHTRRGSDGDQPVVAWERSPEMRQRLLEAYSDRTVWVLEGPTLTGSGYRLVETIPPRTDPVGSAP